MNSQVISFPIHEPLLIFLILIGIILLSPFLFRIIKVPDVASFILMGILIGPYGFNILTRDSSIELLGTIGLLYIMFMAGLELDPDKLKKYRKNSLIFGLATFVIPFVLGFFISKQVLLLGNHATLLISIMFSTHTLVAYPIVRKLGVNHDISVLTAVGGTIITDTLVLFILSIVTQDFHDGGVGFKIVKLLVLFVIYTFIIFYTFPYIAKWFFKYIKRDRPVHYLFLLFMVCLSSYIAELIGTEPIIGAFMAGLAFNRSIPKNSLLMHHIDFVGNVLFIPVFLIEIGMLINTRILISGMYLWYVAFILILNAFVGKWLAAFLSQKLLKFNITQRNLLFGLTSSHAAATIAIILVGYERQMINTTIFNATVLIILVSSLAASFITEKSGKKLKLIIDGKDETGRDERILVPISNPSTMANLIYIAVCFQKSNPIEPIHILNIINENRSNKENIIRIREILEKNVSEFNNLSETLKVITRVDLSISGGIIRTAKEFMISDIIIGWGEKSTTSQRIFGNIFDHLQNSAQTLYTIKLSGNIANYHKFIISIPFNLEYEPSFSSIISNIDKLPKHNDQMIFSVEDEASITKIKKLLPKKDKHKIDFDRFGFNNIKPSNDAVNIFFLFRKQSVAFNQKNNNYVQKTLSSEISLNFIVIVPGFV